ncbi:hypothetical protein BDZ45DRAFT_579202, partial [Acephala macrosclerotiorum]
SNSTISSTPGGDAWHHDLLDYLGKINLGFVALADLRLYTISKVVESWTQTGTPNRDVDVLALTVLGIANASQAWNNLMVHRRGDGWIVGRGFDRITVLDTVFAVLNFGVVIVKVLS